MLLIIEYTTLEKKLNFAFDEKLGYLTACPTNLGTGIRVSAMLHLPGLVLQEQVNQIIQAVTKLGLAVRGLYGEGTEALGHIFQVSNQMTLGESEGEIVERISKVLMQILENESADLDDPDSRLHIDRFIPCLKFFYFPEEVSVENSPLGFVPYSHICNGAYEDAVIGGMKRYYKERTRPFSIDNPTSSRELQITVPGNSLVAAYTNGLHRRVPFLPGSEFGMTRKSLRFDFYSSILI